MPDSKIGDLIQDWNKTVHAGARDYSVLGPRYAESQGSAGITVMTCLRLHVRVYRAWGLLEESNGGFSPTAHPSEDQSPAAVDVGITSLGNAQNTLFTWRLPQALCGPCGHQGSRNWRDRVSASRARLLSPDLPPQRPDQPPHHRTIRPAANEDL